MFRCLRLSVEDAGDLRVVSGDHGQTRGVAEDEVLVPGDEIPAAVDARLVEVAVLPAGGSPGIPVVDVDAERPRARHLLNVELVEELLVEIGRVRSPPAVEDLRGLYELGEVIELVPGAVHEEPAVALLVRGR